MTTTSNCSVENDFATCSVEDVVDTSDAWHIFGTECPKGEIVFLCQVVVLYNGDSSEHIQSDNWSR